MSCEYFVLWWTVGIVIIWLIVTLFICSLLMKSGLMMSVTVWCLISSKKLDKLLLCELNKFSFTHNKWVATTDCRAASRTCSQSFFVVVIKFLNLLQVILLDFLDVFLWAMASIMLAIVRPSMSLFLRHFLMHVSFCG